MGKIYKLRWTIIAATEFEEAIDWLLENWNEKIAADFINNVSQKIELVKKHPFIGSPANYLEDCRKTVITPYHLLIYKILDDSIEIIRLFDGRQDLEKLK